MLPQGLLPRRGVRRPILRTSAVSARDGSPQRRTRPLIQMPTRLKIVATLAALPDGDALSFTRLQDMLGLTPGNLIIHLRKLEEADYISSEKAINGSVSITTVALT